VRPSLVGNRLWLIVLLLILLNSALVGEELENGVQILDRFHYSDVMGEDRHYRIFLPPGFDPDSERRYPVIYYFHGWSQRYSGSQPGKTQYEKGADNEGDNFAEFVAKNAVLIVKWDGFNPRYPGEEYLRPYNIGPVETDRQFPPYFPELVQHIDTHYPSIADRDHRAVTGLSMGGFMAFWVGGKYPHLVGSVSNFMGSDEFVIGPRGFPVEYKHADMFGNYRGRRVRHHMGTKDFIRGYHARMNRTWDSVMDSYEHETYESEHGSAGLGDMLSFHMEAFGAPLPLPKVFDHIDVYPEFEVRGLQVDSDRHHPGFTILEKVGLDGFMVSVRSWLPTGPIMDWVSLSVVTEALYPPDSPFILTDLDLTRGRLVRQRVRSDAEGRIRWRLDGALHEIGIVPEGGKKPVLTLAATEWTDRPWLETGVPTGLRITLVNKGTREARKVRVAIKPHGPGDLVDVMDGESSVDSIGRGDFGTTTIPLRLRVTEDLTDRIRLDLVLTDESGAEWKSDFTLPVNRPGGEVKDFVVADGRTVSVLEYGDKLNRKHLGRGNGDGLPNPGEEIVVLVPDKGALRMTEVTTSDPCVTVDRDSDYWGRFDHVGGSNKVSKLLIASDCPPDRKIPLHFYFLVPDYPVHIPRAGQVTLEVSGSDHTPPWLEFFEHTKEGVLLAKLKDGGPIRTVRAEIEDRGKIGQRYSVELYDDGQNPDRFAGDSLFSALWSPVPNNSNQFVVKLAVTDAAGNSAILETKLGDK